MHDQAAESGSGHGGLKEVADALRQAAQAIDVVAQDHRSPRTVVENVRSNNPNGFGERIRVARKARGLSASVLALRVGVSLKTLYRFESGETAPDATVIAAICRECGVNADWLLFGHGEGPAPRTATEAPSATGTEG